MHQENLPRHQDSRRKFLRVAGFLWLVAMLVILTSALTAPHMGRIVDFVLYQTAYRDWRRLTLRTPQPFFDLSSPERAIKSYYSALYRNDAGAMMRLTAGPFRDQMQRRVAHSEASSSTLTYSSYLYTENAQALHAVVVEKFHLFWRRGLRFNLRHDAADWRIIGIDLVP